ncbi:MAG TPA: MMPL family transporter [Nitrolancea sp.]|nr:MMPL family transporter [Nitrolancea sp.]
MNDSFARFGSALVRGRWLVLAMWIVLLVAVGGFLAPKASSVTKGGGFGVPGSGSQLADSVLETEFHASTSNNAVVVFHSDDKTIADTGYANDVNTATERLQKVEGVGSVVSVFNTGNPDFVSADRHTTFIVVGLNGDEEHVSEAIPRLREQLTGIQTQHEVTGLPAINYDSFKMSERDLHRSELFTLPIVLILLLIVFRTIVAAVLPLILGGSSVVLALAVLYLIGSHSDLSIFALNIASMLGLGLGIDFSLILINRYREERANGLDTRNAVMMMMSTGGRSITYSAITVILSMGVLTFFLRNLMIVRSISMGVLLVAVAGLLAGLTLLPALLAILGDKLEWLRVMPKPRPRVSHDSGTWYRFSHAIMRRPWPWLLLSLLFLVALASPIRDLAMSGATPGMMPKTTESVRGSTILKNAFGAALLTPIQIIVQAPEKNGVWTPKFLDALDQLTNTIKADRRVEEVTSLSTIVGSVPRDGRYESITPAYFVQAPISSNPDIPPTLPGIASDSLLYAPSDGFPTGPAFIGLAQFSMDPSTSVGPSSGAAQEVISISSGNLTVESQGHLTLLRAPAAGAQPTPESVPAGATLTLNPGDQLVIPSQTNISFRSGTAPTQFLGVTVFAAQPGTGSQPGSPGGAAWPDPFTKISRQVLTSGVVDSLPAGQANVSVQRVTVQPGSSMMRHTSPGPELIGVQSGAFTIYGAPEIAATTADGQVASAALDAPINLPAGGAAVVQSGAVNHWEGGGNAPTVFFSTKILSAKEPPLALVGVAQLAAQVVNISGNNDTAVISITARTGEYTSQHQSLVYDLRDSIVPQSPGITPYHVSVGGDAAGFLDFRDSLYGRFPLIVGIVTVMIFFILMMFFQSVFLPIKAMLMNLASILATYGVLVMIFQYGWGARLFGFTPQGLVSAVTPAVLYVILFGLSTDYEVFMLSRVKEYYRETNNNEEAVASGLEHTAGVITAAGLILVGTFGSFASANVVTIKEIGLGLAIGVLLDSTIVRIIMVPATMRLMGATNWWMPAWLKRIIPELSEGPSHVAHPSVTPEPAMALAGAGVPLIRQVDNGVVITPSPPQSEPRPPRRAQMSYVAKLHRVSGTYGRDVIELPTSRPLTIGRDQHNEVQLFDGRVSRAHARVEYSEGQYLIVDLQSANGVVVNGRRIDPSPDRLALHDGDVIEIGTMGVVAFRVELIRPSS